ncbi:MAG TPA: hypothetical protein V6D22_05695 [Candidatus Obscuribacterales bacterium]
MGDLHNQHHEGDQGKSNIQAVEGAKAGGDGAAATTPVAPFGGATLADMCRVSKGFPSNDCQVINTMTDTYAGDKWTQMQRAVFEHAVGSAIEGTIDGLDRLLRDQNQEVAGAFKNMMQNLGYTVKTNAGQPGAEHFLTLLNNQTGNGFQLVRHDFLNRPGGFGVGGGHLNGAHMDRSGKITYGGSYRPGMVDLSTRVRNSLDRE